MKRPPLTYFLVFGAILVVATLYALVHWAVPPFDNFQVFIVSQLTSIFTLLILGILGGAAVGMLIAHRILSNRDFTPFERSVLESLSDIRERLDRLEGTEARPSDRDGPQMSEKARR